MSEQYEQCQCNDKQPTLICFACWKKGVRFGDRIQDGQIPTSREYPVNLPPDVWRAIQEAHDHLTGVEAAVNAPAAGIGECSWCEDITPALTLETHSGMCSRCYKAWEKPKTPDQLKKLGEW